VHPPSAHSTDLRLYATSILKRNECGGAPGTIRTSDPQIRRLGQSVDSSKTLCKPGRNPAYADQYVSGLAANPEPPSEPPNLEDPAEDRVRRRSEPNADYLDCLGSLLSPAHLSNRVVAQLSERWRVVDDPLQWILQRRKGNPRSKSSGWQGRSFCTSREGLLRCVREKCGDVEPAALSVLSALPDHHTPIQVSGNARWRHRTD